jgi:hypothetical protein
MIFLTMKTFGGIMAMNAHPIKKRLLFGMILAVALASVSLLAWTLPQSGELTLVKWKAATDLSDDRKLVGAAHDVFFGQVLEELGQTEERGEPETQFSVKFIEVLKGSVAGVVTVNQKGGYDTEYNVPFRLEGDLQLLEPGKSYLFVTRTCQPRQPEAWHTLVPGYGDIEIQVSMFTTEDEVLGSQHASELRQRFTTAVEYEIPYPPRTTSPRVDW